MDDMRPTARDEWRRQWPFVLAASIGVSFFSFMSPALGLFFDSLHAAFGWDRTELSMGMTFGALIAVVGSPFAGRIIDRRGSRRLASPGLVLTALSIAGFGLADGSLAQWIALWIVFGLISLSVKTTVWSIALAGAIGPIIGGIAYDRAGSYAPLLWSGSVLSLVSAALIFSLGGYPDWDEPAGAKG